MEPKMVHSIDDVEFDENKSLKWDNVETWGLDEFVAHPMVYTEERYPTESRTLEYASIALVKDGADEVRDCKIHEVNMPNYYSEFADMEVPAITGGRYEQVGYHPAGNIETIVRLLAGDGMYRYTELRGYIITINGDLSEVMAIEYEDDIVLLAPYVTGDSLEEDVKGVVEDDVYWVDELVEVNQYE